MHLNQYMGNILNKYNNQEINILYQPQNNLFDILISQLPFNFFIISENGSGSLDNISIIRPNDTNLYQFTLSLTNSILSYAKDKRFNQLGLNTIVFTHSEKPQHIKKEDLYLMDKNINSTNKIFFSEYAKNTWKFSNRSDIIKYGIPSNIFFINKDIKRENKLLLLNLERRNVDLLASILNQNNIPFDIVTDLTKDIAATFNKYTVCLEMNEHNIINLICANACGCYGISPNTPMLLSDFNNLDIKFLNNIELIIQEIRQLLDNPPEINSNIIKSYDFESFSQYLINLIVSTNKEVCLV